MDNSLDLIVLSGSLLVLSLLLQVVKKRKARRRFWVHPYLMERNLTGRFASAFEDLSASQRFFTENFHMDAATFEIIYQKVKRHLQHKKNTRPNDRIPDKMRLAIVLEYLASGTLCRHMSSIYRISKASFKNIVDQVSDAILHEFRDEFMTFSKENWVSVANEFNYRWNFPNCLGAIDGKHVAIQCPPNSGSLFYNYKKFYSIVLMAISDASYKFIYVNVGAYGSEGDSGVFAADKIGKQIYEDKLPLPEDTTIAGHKVQFTFIADDAFPLAGRIMKPYTPPRGSTLVLSKAEFIVWIQKPHNNKNTFS